MVTLFLFSSLHATPLAIMPLGDSITFGATLSALEEDPELEGQTGGYRKHLWYMLQNANIEADFVGTESAGYNIEPPIDPDNEGHPGWTAADIAGWTYSILSTNPPDVILLHIGTNDNSVNVSGVNAILDQIDHYEHDSGKKIKVYIALIIDRRTHDPIYHDFNRNLMQLVGTRIRFGDDLTLVDMHGRAGLQPATDYADEIHPNDAGYYKMAQVWFSALTGPDTPGLYAYPYVIADPIFIDESTLLVDYSTNSVQFDVEIPDEGITF
jgi:hypothetical protein